MKVVLRASTGQVRAPARYGWKVDYEVVRCKETRKDGSVWGGYFVAHWGHRVTPFFGFGVEAYRAAKAEMRRLRETREIESPAAYTARRDELGIDFRRGDW